MKYLRVKNWEKLQHPSPKPLPWIKFFTALLAPTKEPSYSDWPDHVKTLLHHIWLMARVHNNRIPVTWLTKERLNLKSRVSLDPLLESGFVWFEDENGVRLDSGLDSTSSHSHARDARSGVSSSGVSSTSEGERERKPFDGDAEFAALIALYPRPIGLKAARRHFDATVRTSEDLAAINTALQKYLRSDEVKRGFLKHASTWFNNWRDYENLNEKTDGNGHGQSSAEPGRKVPRSFAAADSTD